MKLIIGAFALLVATPLAAQGVPVAGPHAVHAQHNSHARVAQAGEQQPQHQAQHQGHHQDHQHHQAGSPHEGHGQHDMASCHKMMHQHGAGTSEVPADQSKD